MQRQLQSQNKLQALEQGTSHEILFSLLHTAELYALGKNGNRIFKAYEIANSSNNSKDSIRNSLLIKSDSFKNSFLFFKHDWGKYDFPDNLKLDNIINLLEKWESKVNKEDKFIYRNLINLLTGQKYESINYEPTNISKSSPNDIQMGNMANLFNKINHSNNLLDKQILDNVEKNGYYKGKAQLNYNQSKDPIFRDFNPYMNQRLDQVYYPRKIDENNYK